MTFYAIRNAIDFFT